MTDEVQRALETFLKPGATVEEMSEVLLSLAQADRDNPRVPAEEVARRRKAEIEAALHPMIGEALLERGCPRGVTWELVYWEVGPSRDEWGAVVRINRREIEVGPDAPRMRRRAPMNDEGAPATALVEHGPPCGAGWDLSGEQILENIRYVMANREVQEFSRAIAAAKAADYQEFMRKCKEALP
jgi:hypothetical protein